MKKAGLALLAVILIAGAAFAAPQVKEEKDNKKTFVAPAAEQSKGEINFKAGAGIINSVSAGCPDWDHNQQVPGREQLAYVDINGNNPETSIDLSLEYLFKINDFKIGGGATYFMKREWYGKFSNMGGMYEFGNMSDITALPIYVTVQVTPKQVKEAYFKVNVGYTLYSDLNCNYYEGYANDASGFTLKESSSGGIYFGIGAGYEINYGVYVEVLYESFKCEKKYEYPASSGYDPMQLEASYSQIGLKVGYKFNVM